MVVWVVGGGVGGGWWWWCPGNVLFWPVVLMHAGGYLCHLWDDSLLYIVRKYCLVGKLSWVNSLAPWRRSSNFKNIIFLSDIIHCQGSLVVLTSWWRYYSVVCPLGLLDLPTVGHVTWVCIITSHVTLGSCLKLSIITSHVTWGTWLKFSIITIYATWSARQKSLLYNCRSTTIQVHKIKLSFSCFGELHTR